MNMTIKTVILWICLAAAVSLNGCAHLPSGDDASASSLENRVKAMWTEKQEGRWPAVYAFYCESFRNARTSDAFVRSSNLTIQNFSIVDLRMEDTGEAAVVTMRFTSEVRGFELTGIQVTEHWIWERGGWYVCPVDANPKSIIE